MNKLLVVSGLILAVWANPVSAATIIFDNTAPQSTTALTGFSTSGDEMDGMAVTVGLAAGGTNGAIWADAAAGCGSAGTLAGTGWTLGQCNDTFSNDWTLTASVGIMSLFIDAGIGGTIFDTTFGDFEGTPGSASGLTFDTASTFPITVTYSGPVGVGGNPPVGDLYRFMLIEFGRTFEGTLTFGQDTDSSLFRDVVPGTPVPEPASMLLLGGGLAAAAIRRRRANRA